MNTGNKICLFYCYYDDLENALYHINHIKKINFNKIYCIAASNNIKKTNIFPSNWAIKYVVNNPELREAAYFSQLLSYVKEDADYFFCHTKGTTTQGDKEAILKWIDLMYDSANYYDLDNYKCFGTIKKIGITKPLSDNCKWHYSGSFFWFNNFTIPKFYPINKFSVEEWLSTIYEEKQAGALISFINDIIYDKYPLQYNSTWNNIKIPHKYIPIPKNYSFAIIIPTINPLNTTLSFIYQLQNQEYQNFTAYIVCDKNFKPFNILKKYPFNDNIIILKSPHTGYWGHNSRNWALSKIKPADYIIHTNIDNSIFPNFTYEFNQNADADFIYCNWIENKKIKNNINKTVNAKLELQFIDMGAAAIKYNIAINNQIPLIYEGDFLYFQNCAKLSKSFTKINKFLFAHN